MTNTNKFYYLSLCTTPNSKPSTLRQHSAESNKQLPCGARWKINNPLLYGVAILFGDLK